MFNLILTTIISTNLCELQQSLCQGNLNINRIDMPQFVNSGQIETLQSTYLTNYYFMDGYTINNLYPSQQQISEEKVASLAENLDIYASHPIIIHNNYIIDGHHRVFACKRVQCGGLYVLEIYDDRPTKDLIIELKTLTNIRHEL